MKQVINIVLEIDDKIKTLRNKYDSNSSEFLPHMTLVFPFGYRDQNKLECHIKKSLKKMQVFEVSLEEIEESYPFIQFRIKNGKKEFLELRKKLNSGILKNIGEKAPLKHPPHMTIGVVENKKEFKEVVKELKKLKLIFKTNIDKITLMTLDEDMRMKKKEEFGLK